MRICIWRWDRIRRGLFTAGMLLACWALFRWPRAAAAGVSRGLAVCGQILIPTLLPLLVLTDLFCRSGALRPGTLASRITEKLFHLPGTCALPLALGAVGGYPAGAAAIRTLLRAGQLDEPTAGKLLPFCVNAGPAFLIGTVGAGLMGSVYKGVILYICHIAAALLLAMLHRGPAPGHSGKNLPPALRIPLSAAFAGSVAAGVEALLSMCGFVLLFSSFLSLSDASGLTGWVGTVMNYPFTLIGVPLDLSSLWPALWEVGVGTAAVAFAPLSAPISALFLGAAAGWGGVSVHCQIRGILGDRVKADGYFRRIRLLHALLGGGLSCAAFSLLPLPAAPDQGLAVWSTAVDRIQPVSVSAAAAAALLILCGSFLLNIDRFKA